MTPKYPDNTDNDYELGLKFQSMNAGYLRGLRTFRAASETGAHTGKLWSESGTLLVSLPYSIPSGSGWQEQFFITPVPIAAHTTYVVSVDTTAAYPATTQGFAYPVRRGDLTSVHDGQNGVYSDTPGVFPTNTFQSSNYFQDLLFERANQSGTAAIGGYISQGLVLRAHLEDSASYNPASLTYQWYESATGTYGWTPIAGATSDTFTLANAQVGKYIRVTIGYMDGQGNTKEIVAEPLRGSTVTQSTSHSIHTTETPGLSDRTDGSGSVGDWELGMQFTAQRRGQITALRHYKAPSESTTHVGHLWDDAGVELAQVTFVGETASGWQEQALTTPVVLTKDKKYTVSVNIGTHWPGTADGLKYPIKQGYLSSLSEGAVLNDFPGQFPNAAGGFDYFRDVVFEALQDSGAVTLAGYPGDGFSLQATVSDEDGVGSIASYLWESSPDGTSWSTISGATLSTLTLTSGLVGKVVRCSVNYTDLTAVSTTVTSAASATILSVVLPATVFTSEIPASNDVVDTPPEDYELGMGFRTLSAGRITGVKFYKAASETGTHTGRLWSNSGVLLGTVTFQSESAGPGWQTENFAVPITIAGNTNYVISVNTNHHYTNTLTYFAGGPTVNGPLTGLQSYFSVTPGQFPTATYLNSNYFIDVAFQP